MLNDCQDVSVQGSTKEYIIYPKEINVSRKEAQILWHMVNHMRETTHMQEAVAKLKETYIASHPWQCEVYLEPIEHFFKLMAETQHLPAPATTGYEFNRMRVGQMKGLNAWHLKALHYLKTATGKDSPAAVLFEFIVRVALVKGEDDAIAESLAVIHEFFWHIKKVEFIP